MAGFAHTTIVGRITKDLELSKTTSGISLVPFTLVFDHNKDCSTFIDCVAWGKTAENIHKFHKKGDLIGVQGSIEQETWEKDGTKRSRLKVQVRSFEFMPNKKDDRPATQWDVADKTGMIGKDEVLEDIDDKPIDLSEIPF